MSEYGFLTGARLGDIICLQFTELGDEARLLVRKSNCQSIWLIASTVTPCPGTRLVEAFCIDTGDGVRQDYNVQTAAMAADGS